MYKKYILPIILLVLGINTGAQSIENIYTTDGTLYEGYISEQVPGDQISVYSDKVTMSVPAYAVSNYRTEHRKLSTLSASARAHFNRPDENVFVEVVTFEYAGEIYDDVYVVSNENANIKFICFAPKTYVLPWDTIKKTIKQYSYNPKYGLKDIVTLKDGARYVGAIREQVIGKSILFTTENGEELTINNTDIMSLRSEAVDPQVSLWNQAMLLDRIVLKNGDVKVGFIVSRINGQKIIFRTELSAEEESIAMTDIVRYQKTYNPGYRPYVPPAPVVTPKPVKDTTKRVLLNDQEVFFTSLDTTSSRFYFNTTEGAIDVPVSKRVRISLNNIETEEVAELHLSKLVKFRKTTNLELKGKKLPAVSHKSLSCDRAFLDQNENGQKVFDVSCPKIGTYFLVVKDFGNVLVLNAK